MLDLKSLETFIWTMRLGGFRRAAERLNTTQPAISARIAQLQEELGVPLFERVGRRVAPTPQAMVLLTYAERMLALRDELLHAVADRSAIHGVIRLGVAETVVHTWLSRLIERLNDLYPAVSLEVEVETSPNLRDALARHDIDVAVMLSSYTDIRFKSVPVGNYPLAWVASPTLRLPGEPASLEDLAAWPIITFSRTTQPYGVIREMFSSVGLSVRMFGNSSLASVVRMAVDAVGVSVIPIAIVQRELGEGLLRLVDVQHPLPALSFSAAYPANHDNHMASVVAQLAADVAADYEATHGVGNGAA
ncbi:LysR family transcriptional regulator [Azospirillum rugosum]|uniref:DNA-binding transcriptional LysR family regulator n=1 Tax=Azospirillum rugosum TaxID=416170 RepID=A0ABS4SMC9_9PROT|nr:LysR family transcriptional regulator [Azospirillum rugosum]MBP2293721.1 DNA-binding transcriptional LysR family regulator [Azospirillum rugosum]MDQ0527266.1 DNA-binding transcriptional LysR family regulator [Azospirillum rugosum]